MFMKKGRMESSQHLLALYADPAKKEQSSMNVSELYIPKEKRTFKKQESSLIDLQKVNKEYEKKVKFDLN